jgi:hypothetical protein
VLDACRPFEWMSEFPVTVKISDQVKEETLKKWGEKIFF